MVIIRQGGMKGGEKGGGQALTLSDLIEIFNFLVLVSIWFFVLRCGKFKFEEIWLIMAMTYRLLYWCLR